MPLIFKDSLRTKILTFAKNIWRNRNKVTKSPISMMRWSHIPRSSGNWSEELDRLATEMGGLLPIALRASSDGIVRNCLCLSEVQEVAVVQSHIFKILNTVSRVRFFEDKWIF